MERKSGQQDSEAADAEMRDPNLYPGGLRPEAQREAKDVSFGCQEKNHLEKKIKKKLEGPELFLLILLCIIIICMCTVFMCVAQ